MDLWSIGSRTIGTSAFGSRTFGPASEFLLGHFDGKGIARSTTRFAIPISGHWEVEDFNLFPRLFRQAYAFFCYFVFEEQLSHLPDLPMRDGFSSMHFFRDLSQKLPSSMRLNLEAVQYASPGTIVFSGKPEITECVLSLLDQLTVDDEDASASYNLLHANIPKKGSLASMRRQRG